MNFELSGTEHKEEQNTYLIAKEMLSNKPKDTLLLEINAVSLKLLIVLVGCLSPIDGKGVFNYEPSYRRTLVSVSQFISALASYLRLFITSAKVDSTAGKAHGFALQCSKTKVNSLIMFI